MQLRSESFYLACFTMYIITQEKFHLHWKFNEKLLHQLWSIFNDT